MNKKKKKEREILKSNSNNVYHILLSISYLRMKSILVP